MFQDIFDEFEKTVTKTDEEKLALLQKHEAKILTLGKDDIITLFRSLGYEKTKMLYEAIEAKAIAEPNQLLNSGDILDTIKAAVKIVHDEYVAAGDKSDIINKTSVTIQKADNSKTISKVETIPEIKELVKFQNKKTVVALCLIAVLIILAFITSRSEYVRW